MQDIENHIINNENMKITKKLILALALMAVFLPQLLAQNNNVIMCADTDCVFEILEKCNRMTTLWLRMPRNRLCNLLIDTEILATAKSIMR